MDIIEIILSLILLLSIVILLVIYVIYSIYCLSSFTRSPKKDKDQKSMWDPPSPIRRILNNWFDSILIKKLLKRLESLDKDYWLWYGHQFSDWRFPVEFYDLIPRWYSKRGRYIRDRRYKLTRPIFERIYSEFSVEEQLRFHNVIVGRMSEAEFDYWYSISCTDKEAERTYYDRHFYVKQLRWWENEIFEKLRSIGLVNDPISDEEQIKTS
jgi:hypothetical protein